MSQTFRDLTSRSFDLRARALEVVSHVIGFEMCALHWQRKKESVGCQRECWEHPILCETCILSLVFFHWQADKIRTWTFARIARIMLFPPHLFNSDPRSRFTFNFEHRSYYITAVNVQHSPKKEKKRLRRHLFHILPCQMATSSFAHQILPCSYHSLNIS